MPTFREDIRLGTKVPQMKTEDYEDASVTNEKLAVNSITKDKLKDKTIGVEKLDTELRQTIAAATGLTEELVESIQNMDETVSEHTKQIESNQSQITANKSAQDKKNISLEENMKKLNVRDDQITESLKGITASGGASVASAVTYNNTSSQLVSATVQGAVDELQDSKIDKTSISQELGDSEDKVMSQKVVSDKLSDLDDIIMGEYEYPTILSKKEFKKGYYASNTACKVCIYDITKVAGTTITLDVEGPSWNSIDYAIVKDYRKIAESQSDYNEEVWNANLLEVVTIQGGPITKAIDLSSDSIVNAAKEGSIYLVCNLGLTNEATPLKKTIGLAENVERLKEKQEYNIYPSKIDGKLVETSTNTDYYYGNLGTHTTDLLVYGVRMRNPYTKTGVFIKKYDLLSQTLSDICPVNGTNISNVEQIDVYFNEPILLKKSEILVTNWNYIYSTNYVSAVVQPNATYMLGNIKENSILSLQYICKEISCEKSTDKNAVLFNSDMKSENIYIEKTSCQYSAEGLTFTEYGDANYIYLNKRYFSDKRFARFSVSMGSDTILVIPVANIKDKQNKTGGSSCFSVDFKNRKIVIYASGNGSDSQGGSNSSYDLKNELETVELPTEFIKNGEYIIEIHKNNTESSLIIFNVLSGDSYSVSHDGWGAGRQNDYYSMYCQEGAFPTIRDFSVYSLNNPDVNEVGDSISEGVGVVDRSKRFTQQFRDSNKDKKVVISARGGANIINVCSIFKSEFIYTNPKKISMLIGTNIGISNTNMCRLWALNKMVNAEITMHLTPASGEVNYKATNANIRTLAPKFGFKIGAKFDVATSIGNNPESGYNSDLFFDATHPDVNGQTKMFQRMKIDAPDLFYK